ncbi:MAG: type I methionyl aminopeptidase [Propionibacteriaceae bacterium]
MRGVEIKTPEQILIMRKAGLVVHEALSTMAKACTPGMTTAEIDAVGREVLAQRGATSSFLGYGAGWGMPAYPGVACISVNEEIVHGIPGERKLVDGDLVSIDFGAIVDGWHGDAAVSVLVGKVAPEVATLSDVTRDAMWHGLAAAQPGQRLSNISSAIEDAIDAAGDYGIVADYTGHGIGSQMHQNPDVPNFGRPGRGIKLIEGLCIAIEPMVTIGSAENHTLSDEWTVATNDGSVACHWEHTIAITRGGAWVLTAEDGGEELLAKYGATFAPVRGADK